MWNCPNCRRLFSKENQQHSCKKVPLNKHFENKEQAKELFNYLLEQINKSIGNCEVISIPCCIHLFGKYDFLATLPKKDRLEIRFALDRKINSTRLKVCVPLSTRTFKNCIDIFSTNEIDEEIIGFLKEAYFLKKQ